jgi:methionyl-tRNA synthetase
MCTNIAEEKIPFETFEKIKLKVGTILSCEKVEKSRKLLKFIVDVGSERRQILSGIAQYYSPEELVGKKVVVVTNLEPVTIMGLESQGMLLSAAGEDTLELIEMTQAPTGSDVC